MHGPVDAEINRSSRISPSIGTTVSYERETARVLAARRRLDGGNHLVLDRTLRRRADRIGPPPPAPVAPAVGERGPDHRGAPAAAQKRPPDRVRDPRRAVAARAAPRADRRPPRGTHRA